MTVYVFVRYISLKFISHRIGQYICLYTVIRQREHTDYPISAHAVYERVGLGHHLILIQKCIMMKKRIYFLVAATELFQYQAGHRPYFIASFR